MSKKEKQSFNYNKLVYWITTAKYLNIADTALCDSVLLQQ